MLDKLTPPRGAVRKKTRVGRGESSGLGKTSGRGHKGAKARAGGGARPGYEGGQMPLTRRLPKVGFKSPFRKIFSIINVGKIAGAFSSGDTVDRDSLLKTGLIKSSRLPVKVLGEGDIKIALTIKAAHFSGSAKEKITKAGGKIEVTGIGG